MNEISSKNRYFKLLQKELTERAPMIFKIAAVFSLLLVAYWLLLLVFKSDPSSALSRINYIKMALFLTMIIAPFNLYKSYNHRKKGIDYILLPASITEKFLSMQFICVIALPLVVLTSILVTDTVLSTITPSIFSGYTLAGLWSQSGLYESLFNAFVFQQGCILGNLIFRKNKIIKTCLSGLGIFIVLGLILSLFLSIYFKGEFESLHNISINIDGLSQTSTYGIDLKMANVMKWVYYFAIAIYDFILPVSFISGSYYIMKNQQY